MNKRRAIILSLFTLLLIGLIVVFIIASTYNEIQNKSSSQHLRIGYLNLHEAELSEEQLKKFVKFDCDIWLFLEWNGDNFKQYPKFEKNFNVLYELEDSLTFGCYVLANKDLVLNANEFDAASRPYACDYPKILLSGNDFNIGFIHSPPPVPTCDFETEEYINDLLGSFEKEGAASSQILIGDFNLLAIQDSYQDIIDKGYVDVFEKQNFLKGTFSGILSLPKFLRIDYIFSQGKSESVYSERFFCKESDHSGLIADFD